jgi:hypothetical protein
VTWERGTGNAASISAGETDLTSRAWTCAVLFPALCLLRPAPLQGQAGGPAYRNVVSVLTAATLLEGDVGATFGIAYERRLGRWYGLGPFADYLTTSNRNVATGIAFYMHPTRAIRVIVAPGVDFRRTGPDLVLLRMGVGYDIRLGPRWSLTPEVNIDFEGGYRVYVVGAELGWRF